jgi:hypothetical protein
MAEVSRWNPVLVVDAHGMGAQETHLFSPPREPVNAHFPPSDERWGRLFARDQAAAFDRHGLVYYHGEWNEGWYPGYTDAWPVFRGAVGILYEQARIAEDGVRRPEGRILSYRESVFHHVIGSMANLGRFRRMESNCWKTSTRFGSAPAPDALCEAHVCGAADRHRGAGEVHQARTVARL